MTEFGWRARIGLILPADNTVAEPELYSLGLPGVSFHTVRLSTTDHGEMRAQAVSIAGTLAEMGVDVAVYGCAETSFDAGGEERENLSSLIRAAGKVPVVTATGAMLAALSEREVRRLALVTPYTRRSGSLLEQTLAEDGFDVVAAIHRDFRETGEDPREWYETNRRPPTTAYGMVRSVDTPEAEAVLVSATNLPFLPLLEQAERDLGKPVVSSNQSVLWWCLRELGIKEPVMGYGELLRRPR